MAVSIYYQNVRGLRTKTNDVYKNILINNYNIIVFTETWLNCNISNSEFIDERYTVYRRDRMCSESSKKDGGGVLIAVSNCIPSSRLIRLESKAEDLWVAVNLKVSNTVTKVLICVVYMPPPVTLEHLNSFLEHVTDVIDNTDQVIILGDFNLSFINWSRDSNTGSCIASNYNSPLGLALTDFLSLNNISQTNDITNIDGKILDLILTNNTVEVTNSVHILSKIDNKHPPLLITLLETISNFLKPVQGAQFNFFKANYVKILENLKNINWIAEFGDCHDVNEMTALLYRNINETVENYVQKRKPKNSRYPLWFTKPLIKIILEKETKRKKYIKYGNPRDKIEYELLRERSQKLIDLCLRNYKKQIESNIRTNPKFFWRFIKDRRGGGTTIPAEMFNSDETASTGTHIAQLFAKNFSSVYGSTNLPNGEHLIADESPYLCSLKFNEQEVIREIKKIDIFKGAGPDEIPPVFIKRCGPALALPLSQIFNRSLCDGVFPDLWKRAKIVPVHKKGDTRDVKNYRPISILSCMSKLFESLVCPFITRHLENVISENQHGFKKGRSVQTNLVSFMSYLGKEIDRGRQVDAIYMDFSSAFDKVCHSRLLCKLRKYGIDGNLLQWFKSYLAKRLQFVVLNGHKSHEYVAHSGVPQGSHLGPVLFSAFINDITCSIQNCRYSLFADDLKIYKTVESTNDAQLIQKDLDQINAWCDANGMIVNTKKTYHIKYTRKKKSLSTIYKLNLETLEEVKEIRDLGVMMDSQLKFKVHVDAIVKQAAKMLGFIKRNTKGFISPITKIILFNSLVRSKLEFASTVWNPQYTVNSQRIERLQRSFTRHLAFYSTGISHKATYDLRLKHFNMISLYNRRILLDVTFLKKLLSGEIDCNELTSNINLNIPYRYPRHTITNIFYVTVCRTNVLKHSPLPRICSEYNRVSELINEIDIFHDSGASLRKKLTAHFCK